MDDVFEALEAMYYEFGENFPPGERTAVDMARDALGITREPGDEAPRIIVHVPPGVAGEPVLIMITCWDNDQEIAMPVGWKLEKEYRHFNQNKYQAVISLVRTDMLNITVAISLKNDTLATAHIVDRDYKIAPY